MSDEKLQQESEVFGAALVEAKNLAEETRNFFATNSEANLAFAAVEIVLGNPTVKEYKVTIVPGH